MHTLLKIISFYNAFEFRVVHRPTCICIFQPLVLTFVTHPLALLAGVHPQNSYPYVEMGSLHFDGS